MHYSLRKFLNLVRLTNLLLIVFLLQVLSVSAAANTDLKSEMISESANNSNSGIKVDSPKSQNPSNFFPLLSGMMPNMGPFSFGANYDSLLGAIYNAGYAQKFNDNWAASLLGDYGANQYRINGTVATQLSENLQFKFSSEYLSQDLPFDFYSGKLDERVGQRAYGLQLRQNFDNQILQNLYIGGYFAKAPSKNLSSMTIIEDSLQYTNDRHLAGSKSQGINIGTDLAFNPKTLLKLGVLYDAVNYDSLTGFSGAHDRFGMGGSLKLEQIIDDYTKITLSSENRAMSDTYGSELHLLPGSLLSGGSLDISIFAERMVSKGQIPDSNRFGINVSLALDGSNSGYTQAKTEALKDLLSWVKDPAVHMAHVGVESEQRKVLNGPVALSISPSGGPTTGGGTVTITGNNFLPGVVVTFAGVNADIISVTSTQIVVTVPDLSLVSQNNPSLLKIFAEFFISSAYATPPTRIVDVVVTNPDGQRMTFSQSYTLTASNPTLTLLSPDSGVISGGTSVTITGTHLTGTTAVTFGGVAATSLNVVNDTTITLVTPAHGTGSVDIAITNPQGTGTLVNGYTYLASAPTITSISPTSGFTTGGTSVTITGTDFTDATNVTFGSTEASSFNIDSSTSITAVSPAGSAGVVDITVTTPSGTSTISSADQFTYTVPPQIIFLSSSTYNGNLGGFSGANAKCNTDAAKPSSGFAADYTYKALLNGNNATTNGVSYYRADGTTLIATATGGNLVSSSSLVNTISSVSSFVWTGANGSSTCSNWTSGGAGTGNLGSSNSATSTYWNSSSISCSSTLRLYCVSQ